MPGLTLTIGLLTAVAFAIGAYFGKDDDHGSRPSSDSSSRSHGTPPNRTRPSHPPPPSSSNTPNFRAHSQSTSRTPPAASGNYHSPYYVPPHAGEARQAPPTSARTQASYQSPSNLGYGHGTQPTAKTATTKNYGRSHYDSPLTPSPYAGHQTASTSSYAQATYQRSTDPGPDSARVFQSSVTHSYTRASESAYPQALPAVGRSKSTRVAQPSPVPAFLSDSEPDELDNDEDVAVAEELRERAGRLHRKMLEARTQAENAYSLRDYAAEGKHEREATTYESARDQLNTRAAGILFKHTNKVCTIRRECQGRAQLLSHLGSQGGNG
jgi:hypothetical protein